MKHGWMKRMTDRIMVGRGSEAPVERAFKQWLEETGWRSAQGGSRDERCRSSGRRIAAHSIPPPV